jgi:uncharacterized Zn finger protein
VSNSFPPPSRPRPVEGGLVARSRRGAIAQTWWSERFIDVLESIGVGSRLQRGRSYARQGQVISLDVHPGVVTAQVQGSRARPYRVRIGVAAFGKSQWADLERTLAVDAWYAAQLLNGAMPEDIEDVFTAVGLSLFPARASDLTMDCSCPDWQVPCKHIAATFYLLAEAFDADPFAILAWRGRERDDLLDNLRAARSADMAAADYAEPTGKPLGACLDTYFALQAGLPVRGPAPTASDALLSQLPAIDLSVRGANVVDLLRPVYQVLGEDAPT